MIARRTFSFAVVTMTAAFGYGTAAAQDAWIDNPVGTPTAELTAFESPAAPAGGTGGIPDGWTNGNPGTWGDVVVSNETIEGVPRWLEGSQSALIMGQVGIERPRDDLPDTGGSFSWMFYDDMAADKNVRVGLKREVDLGAGGGPRFGAIAVEGQHTETHYVAHFGFAFTPMTAPPRAEGWREMRLEWDIVETGTEVRYYVDNVLGHTHLHTPGVGAPVAEFMGAPFGTATPAWVDVPADAAPLLPGDANRDGRVDGEDFLIWQAAFGTQEGATWDDGDFNGDGRVDGEDFLIWQAHFGQVAGSSAVTPEPAALSLLVLAGAGLIGRRRSA